MPADGKRKLKRMTSDLSNSNDGTGSSRITRKRSSQYPVLSKSVAKKEKESPVRLDIREDVDRPYDEGIEKEELEFQIERKRLRVNFEARHKAEKI